MKTSECDAKLNNNDLEDQGESKHDVDVSPMIKKRKRKGCEFSDGSHQGLTYDANHESDEPNKKSRKKKKKKKNKSKDPLEASIDNHLALIPGVSHIKSHYLTLSKFIMSDAGRDLFWDVAGRNLYRLSSDGACMLKSYIDKLMASHAKGYVHNCADGDDLAKNIGFHRNEFTRIKLLNKQKALPGLLEDFKIKDFSNLANLIDKARGPRGLGQFPEELANFVALLHDPIGKEHLILCHYALWSSKERIQYVAAFVRKLEMPRFSKRCEKISELDVKLAAFCNKKEFWTIFKGDRVMEEGFNRSLARTRVASKRRNELEDDDSDDPKDEKKKKKKNNRFYRNNFKELIRFIRNQTSHTTVDSEEVVYTAYRVEWKVFQYFPFYISWLCEYLIEEGLYPRIS